MNPAGRDDREALLRDAALRRSIEAVARGRVREWEIEDVVQLTHLAIAQAASLPEEPAERRRYILGIARKQASELRRKNGRQVAVQDDAEVDSIAAPAVAAESVENIQLFTKIVKAVPRSEIPTLQCYARYVLGENLADMARELGVEYDTLYKRVTALHKRMRATGILLGGLAVIALLVCAVWTVLRPKPEMAHPEITAPSSVPALSTPEPQSSLLERAGKVRAKAFDECVRNDWSRCLNDLNDARKMDAAGEDDPLVRAARADALAGLDATPDWKPPVVRPYAGKGTR